MKLINIYRDKFTVVPNEVLFDKRLDFRSRGVLATILSLPDGWNFSIVGLAELVDADKRGEGKDAIRAALQYLEQLGYIQRIQQFNERRQFVGYDYKINIPPLSGFPTTDNPTTGNPTQSKT